MDGVEDGDGVLNVELNGRVVFARVPYHGLDAWDRCGQHATMKNIAVGLVECDDEHVDVVQRRGEVEHNVVAPLVRLVGGGGGALKGALVHVVAALDQLVVAARHTLLPILAVEQAVAHAIPRHVAYPALLTPPLQLG